MRDSGYTTMAGLAEWLNVKHPAMSNRLAHLHRLGLLTRTEDGTVHDPYEFRIANEVKP